MKKNLALSFFVALVFSLFGANVNAQVVSYEPAPFWDQLEVSRTVGQITKVMSYDFNGETYIRRVVVNSAPFGIPNYNEYATIAYEGPLTGSGIDTVCINLPPSQNLGWSASVKILDNEYNLIGETLLFNQVQPLAPLQIEFPDPQYGYGGSLASRSISYNPVIASIFNPPDGENYTNIFNVRLTCDGPSGYDVTRTAAYTNFSSAEGFIANFNLPLDISGEWCLDAWVSVTHNSITPKYWNGEKIQWYFSPPCFTWVDITTGLFDGKPGDQDMPQLFPNPFVDVVTIDSPWYDDYIVVSMTGQQVTSGRLFAGENRLSELSGLPSGVYVLKTIKGQISVRMVKQ
jgi:hypothetical protein